MGIFDRLKTVVSSNINDLINKAENPEKMLNQLLLDMNEQMINAKKAVAMAIADEKKLEREAIENKNQAAEWEKKAMLAVRASRDDLAKEALVRKQEFETYHGQLITQWQAQKESVEKLKESLRTLQNKIDEASRKKNILIARAKRAEAQDRINQTMSSLSGNKSAFDTFDRMAKKVDELEARTEAHKELEEATSGATLEKQFAQLESSGAGADLLLEELKAKMITDGAGAPSPGGAGGSPKP
jgi:phage shock protein A